MKSLKNSAQVWHVFLREHVPYLSASAVVIHYEEALYQVNAPLPLPVRGGGSIRVGSDNLE